MTNQAITKALAPTRGEIIEGTKEVLHARVEIARQKITEADFDLNIAFPINYNSYQVNVQKADRQFALTYAAIKEATPSAIYRRNAPIPVTLRDPEIVAEKIAEAAERHADDLLATYAAKLTAKVAEHAKKKGVESEIAAARYVGTRNPWQTSTLEVKLTNGAKMTLTTSIIVNVSKLGKLFNQFPTRLKSFGTAEPTPSDCPECRGESEKYEESKGMACPSCEPETSPSKCEHSS